MERKTVKKELSYIDGDPAPWYYGHAYHDTSKNISVRYIVPFHLFVRWWYAFVNRWFQMMSRHSMIDAMMREAINQVERKWESEFDERLRQALHQFKKQQAREIRRLLEKGQK